MKREIEIIVRDKDWEIVKYTTAEDFIKLDNVAWLLRWHAMDYIRTQESNHDFVKKCWDIYNK